MRPGADAVRPKATESLGAARVFSSLSVARVAAIAGERGGTDEARPHAALPLGPRWWPREARLNPRGRAASSRTRSSQKPSESEGQVADREQPDPVAHDEPNRVSREDSPQANAALGVAGLGVILYVLAIFIAEGRNEWLWPLALVLGAAGAIM